MIFYSFRWTKVLILLGLTSFNLHSQTLPWHGIARELCYQPDSSDFVIENGSRRFNRALYGSNTAFRVEAGDLPEFALYLPGMGGNVQLGIITNEGSKWVKDAEYIEARYRPGSMIYTIKDPLLGNGTLRLQVIASFRDEGMLLEVTSEGVSGVNAVLCYGGITGKRFRRDGDIGADPESSFYLTADKCATNEVLIESPGSAKIFFGEGRVSVEDERYENESIRRDDKEQQKVKSHLSVTFSGDVELRSSDAAQLSDPLQLWTAETQDAPVLTARWDLDSGRKWLGISKNVTWTAGELNKKFVEAEMDRQELAGRIKLITPDPYLNNLGGALAVAGDAIWESPSYLHGAIAWRMPLVGWRGAYTADWLGWHDRARTHFSSYALSQYTEPAKGPSLPNPETNLARQTEEIGTALFTSGYISRRPGGINKPHHYDMNLVYIDQLIRHFEWTGDTAYIKEMWPVIERHLAWEKRNFDPDDDGLYNAYACIWASDALEYNGGGVAYSSAYNYFENMKAARLAKIIGLDGTTYEVEANKIFQALNNQLWMDKKGTYAEYEDLLGHQEVHPQAGLWSVYHLIDSEVPDALQAYLMTRYVDQEIPKIPIEAKGLPAGQFYTLSTTNWMPYTWSVNNVALAEVLHGALAYWQARRPEEGFQLWKSALVESMYLGACPGNFQQLSFYDAMRGELYRDFSDPVAMAARTLVEGLFGIKPDLLVGKVVVRPGFPDDWDHARLETPDFEVAYKRTEWRDLYTIMTSLPANLLELHLKARSAGVEKVLVNGTPVQWETPGGLVGKPGILLSIPMKTGQELRVEVQWSLEELYQGGIMEVHPGQTLAMVGGSGPAQILETKDPQGVFSGGKIANTRGYKTIFQKVKQDDFEWWEPIHLRVRPQLELKTTEDQPENQIRFEVTSHLKEGAECSVVINDQKTPVRLKLNPEVSKKVSYADLSVLRPGTNKVEMQSASGAGTVRVVNWNIRNNATLHHVDLLSHFNDAVTNIFRNEYLSPRSEYPTLQIPIHGLGDWCRYNATMEIDDSGLRSLVKESGKFQLPNGITFSSPAEGNNVIFTSLWDNYPDRVVVPLSGKATHAYFLMTGTTNPMQSRFENGRIIVHYTDGTGDTLSLRNPDTWWPIEQDYFDDGFAFDVPGPAPVRVHLKTGWIGREHNDYVSIDGFTNYAIDGGAATVFDLPLDGEKELGELKLETVANDVVIGLMGISFMP